ncbi:growth arrest-specific protein 1a [Clupea harengus]|uniref:Growth arrest-specific protein 1a n=1 Tax=Clupea harengus TaxID=7950 RepID=A0A6P3VXK4_CLUHA|nr:growth arrest-specific protein 1a [Clupea harengus]
MATFAGLAQSAYKHLWPFGCIVMFFSYLCIASPAHGRRLICWQAILNCQNEADCLYAYEQYIYACEPILTGQRRKCPSHCISSLVQLNLTRNGPALEDCSCDTDERCKKTKRAIEPCLPKTSNMGCTEARRQCERDTQCRSAMGDYLIHCGKLFSGAICTNACRNVIAQMRKIPKAQSLDTCVCDGTERTICEFIKVNMKNLCFDSPPLDDEGGSGDHDDDDEDVIDEDLIRIPEVDTGCSLSAQSVLTLVASILVLLPFL